MIWKKKKDAAAQSAEAAGEMTGAKGRTGAGAFAKKNWKWLVPLVVVAAAGAVFLIGGGRNGAASRDVTYAETTPVRQDVSNSLSGTGTLNPANTYTVKSLVDGKILTGGFEEGDKVEEGDVLYTIDSSDMASSVEKAQLSLDQAQSSYGDTVGSSSSTTETMCVIYDLSYLEMTLDVDELDILDIQVGQKAEITADAISDRTFEGVVTSISSAGTTSGGTTTYPVTIRIDDTGSLMPGMNATAALDIPPCRRYVIVKATAGFAVFRLILKSLLFYSCLDFTQNLGKTHFCLTFGVHFSIRSLFFGIFFNVFAIGIYSFDSCFLSTTWIS